VTTVGDAVADTLGLDTDVVVAKLAPKLIEGLKDHVGEGGTLSEEALRTALISVLNDVNTRVSTTSVSEVKLELKRPEGEAG
jgi:hypothetical protein